MLIGCTREQLENHDFKSTPLGEEWIRYGYADGFQHIYKGDIKITQMINKECSKEKYEEEHRINWQTAYKHEFTPRVLMQLIGTDLFRDKLLNNIWVNALFADYKEMWNDPDPIKGNDYTIKTLEIMSDDVYRITYGEGSEAEVYKHEIISPNWIITDVRFPNELEAIKKRNGIVIRVNRYDITGQGKLNPHTSETALDDADFDYVLDNYGTVEDLIDEVEEMLIHFKII